MKKSIIVLIAALTLGVASMDAQANKFKAAASKTNTKATTTAKAAAPKAAATAAPKATAAKKAAAKAIDNNTYNGTWANRYPDGIGGTVTDYLTIQVDENGAVTAQYIDESGDTRNFTGTVKSGVMTLLDGDGDEFATARFIDGNTIKLEGFTGTFKRVKDTTELPETDKYNSNVQSAPVDPAFEEVKKYLENP